LHLTNWKTDETDYCPACATLLPLIANRPILGMVSLVPNEGLRRVQRRNRWLFAGGVGSLFASFAAVIAFALMLGRLTQG